MALAPLPKPRGARGRTFSIAFHQTPTFRLSPPYAGHIHAELMNGRATYINTETLKETLRQSELLYLDVDMWLAG